MNDAIFSLSLNMPSARVCVRPQIKENVTQEPAKGTRKSDEELAALLGRLMYVSEYGPNYRLLKSREAKVHTYIFLFTVLCIRDEQKNVDRETEMARGSALREHNKTIDTSLSRQKGHRATSVMLSNTK